MNIQSPRAPLGPQPWEVVRSKLDQALPFANMRGTPYYRDAVYEQFSEKEYARRYAALRDKMREHKLDAVIAAGGPEPLELRRRHAVADRPCRMARARLLRAGAARWRADHDLFDGRHACGSGAPHRRGGGQGRAPQPQRPLCRGDGRAAQGIEARARPHRPDGDRPAPRRLHAGQSVQHAAHGSAGRRTGVHQGLPARPRRHPQRRRARLRAQGRRAVPERDGGDGRARQARREGIRAARRGRRRHPGRRRRHRLPHHRLDADGQSGADLRQSAPLAAAC